MYQVKSNYYFLLFNGRYLYDDQGENYSLPKMADAVREEEVEIMSYSNDETEEAIIKSVQQNSSYHFFNRGVLVRLQSRQEHFDKNNFEIISYKPFKISQ